MKLSTILALCLVSSVATAQHTQPNVADLAWMAGCWVHAGDDSTSYVSEQWTKPLGKMLGTNRTVRNGSVGGYEFLRVEEKEGDIYFVARPSFADQETGFKLTSLEGKRVVFENPDHDFPKRLVYSLSSVDVLTARVEDDDSGFSQVFRKVSCDE